VTLSPPLRVMKARTTVSPAWAGEAKPTATEQLELARLCHRHRKELAAAVGFYAAAFAASLDPDRELLYEAARAAAGAGCGQGKDTGGLMPEDMARLRAQALAWLREGLTAWQGKAAGGQPGPLLDLARHLSTWQTDPALAGVREVKGLGELPSDERKAWEGLWAGVGALVKGAEARFRTVGRWQGLLDGKHRERAHEVNLQAGRTYVFTLEGKRASGTLTLEDAAGQTVARGDHSPEGRQCRLVLTPARGGTYRALAASTPQRPIILYALLLREFVARE
jgi:hypothetical protein